MRLVYFAPVGVFLAQLRGEDVMALRVATSANAAPVYAIEAL